MKKIAVFTFVLFSFSVLVSAAAFAGTLSRDNKSVVLSANETVNGDYFAEGDSVMLSGTVNGNAYVAGGTVLVDGTINGDLFVAGGTITIRGTVRNDVRAAGGTVTLSGPIGGGAIVVGGNIQFTDSARVGGSLVSGSGTLQVFSPVGRGITAGAGQLVIGNTVGGNILAGAGQFTLSSGARVNGDITYSSEEEFIISDDARITGTITEKIKSSSYPKAEKDELWRVLGAFVFVFKTIQFLGLLILGFILLKIAPIFLRKTTEVIGSRPWFSLLVGFLTLLVIPFAVVALILTLVGIPLALILLASFAIFWPVSHVIAGYFIGRKVLALAKRKERTYGAFALGLLLLYLVQFIPFIGWVISCVIVLMALGALLIQKKEYMGKMRSHGMI